MPDRPDEREGQEKGTPPGGAEEVTATVKLELTHYVDDRLEKAKKDLRWLFTAFLALTVAGGAFTIWRMLGSDNLERIAKESVRAIADEEIAEIVRERLGPTEERLLALQDILTADNGARAGYWKPFRDLSKLAESNDETVRTMASRSIKSIRAPYMLLVRPPWPLSGVEHAIEIDGRKIDVMNASLRDLWLFAHTPWPERQSLALQRYRTHTGKELCAEYLSRFADLEAGRNHSLPAPMVLTMALSMVIAKEQPGTKTTWGEFDAWSKVCRRLR